MGIDISKQTRPLLFYIFEYTSMISIVFFLLFPATFANKALYISAAIWILFTFINDTTDFCTSFFAPSIATYSIYVWVIFRMFCTLFTDIPYMDTNYFATGFAMLFALYYLRKRDKICYKIIVFTALIAITLTIIFSVGAMIDYSSNIIRKLATPFKDEYNYTGVAGYSWTYGLLFFSIGLSGMMIYRKRINNNYLIEIIIVYLVCIFAIFILSTSYLIAVVLLLFAFLLYLAQINNMKSLLIVATLLITAFIIFWNTGLIRQLMIFVGNLVPNYYFKERILGLVELLDTNWGINAYTEAAAARLINYITSIRAFEASPFVGMLNERYIFTGFYQGGDSAILGELARFGIIGSLPLFTMIGSLVKEVMKIYEENIQQQIFFVCIVMLIIFSLINTSFTPTIMFYVFSLVPSFLLVTCKGVKHEDYLVK